MLKNRLIAISFFLPVFGCTTLVAPSEVESLQNSTVSLASAIKSAEQEQEQALLAIKIEEYRILIAKGATAADLVSDCESAVIDVNEKFEALSGSPYDSVDQEKFGHVASRISFSPYLPYLNH